MISLINNESISQLYDVVSSAIAKNQQTESDDTSFLEKLEDSIKNIDKDGNSKISFNELKTFGSELVSMGLDELQTFDFKSFAKDMGQEVVNAYKNNSGSILKSFGSLTNLV